MTIAEVSRKYDISADTLRYYERIGLMRHVRLTESGIRDYTEQDCARIQFIKCMRGAGCSIAMLQKYSRLCREGDETVPERLALLKAQYSALEEKERALKESLAVLRGKIDTYDQHLLQLEKSCVTRRDAPRGIRTILIESKAAE